MDDTIVQQATEKRKLRALRIVAAGQVSPNGQDGQYDVRSQSGNGAYLTRHRRVTDGDAVCDCPDFFARRHGIPCKHVWAVETYERAERYVERQVRRLDSIQRVIDLAQARLHYDRETLSEAGRLTLRIIVQTAQRLDRELWQAAEAEVDRRKEARFDAVGIGGYVEW